MLRRNHNLIRRISLTLVTLWLALAIQPSVMAATAMYQAALDCGDMVVATPANCCEKAVSDKSVAKDDCSLTVCATMQRLEHQSIDQTLSARLTLNSIDPPVRVIGLANDFCGAYSSVYQRHQVSPLTPHPTLQFCTLLI